MMTVPPRLTSSLPSFSYPASFRHPPPASSCIPDHRESLSSVLDAPNINLSKFCRRPEALSDCALIERYRKHRQILVTPRAALQRKPVFSLSSPSSHLFNDWLAQWLALWPLVMARRSASFRSQPFPQPIRRGTQSTFVSRPEMSMSSSFCVSWGVDPAISSPCHKAAITVARLGGWQIGMDP